MLISNSRIVLLATFLSASIAPSVFAEPSNVGPADSQIEAALSDPEIAGIVSAVNEKDLNTSRLAQTSGTNQKIIDFANLMVKEHTRLNTEFTAVLRKVGVAEQTGSTADDLRSEGVRQLATLQSLSGMAFDKEYIQEQVLDNQHFAELLDNSLIPSAQNPDIKSYLTAMRGDIGRFVANAAAIQKDLGG